MPSMQSSIVEEFEPNEVIVAGLNHTVSRDWLVNYSLQKSITFPILYDAGSIHDEYQIGYDYGNMMPNWLLIGKDGKIKFRNDSGLGIVEDLKILISTLVDN